MSVMQDEAGGGADNGGSGLMGTKMAGGFC